MRSDEVKRGGGGLTVELVGRDVRLECACGFVIQQLARDAIAARCPKCGRRW